MPSKFVDFFIQKNFYLFFGKILSQGAENVEETKCVAWENFLFKSFQKMVRVKGYQRIEPKVPFFNPKFIVVVLKKLVFLSAIFSAKVIHTYRMFWFLLPF